MTDPRSRSLVTVGAKLASDLVAGGTLVVSYPAGYSGGHFQPLGHRLSVVNGGNYEAPRDFSVVFGAAAATITWATGMPTIPAGSDVFVQFDEKGTRAYRDQYGINKKAGGRVANTQVRELNFGTPVAAAAASVAAITLLAAAGFLPLVGGGPVVLDVPRNITLTVATTNQSGITFTITGLDEYGNLMVETLAGPNANTVQGNKAFKQINSVYANAAIETNGVSVGVGNKLGLPIFVPNSVFVLKEIQDGAVAVAGTFVAGVVVKQTGTTGDVRGTYVPNAAPDGAKAYSLLVALEDAQYTGPVQFAG